MLPFLAKRLLQLIPTLFFVSVIIFGLQQLLPGDPALAMAGEERDPAVLEQIRKQYRLDQPVYAQRWAQIGAAVALDPQRRWNEDPACSSGANQTPPADIAAARRTGDLGHHHW